MPTITGDGRANALTGSAEADTISGMGGADTLSGGDGADTLYGHSAGAAGLIAATPVITGLSLPVAAAAVAFDPGFLYIAEKNSGIIWRADAATGARSVFLDIPDAQFLDDGERGVLGLAFHPEYADNGRFFVFLTDAEGDLQVREYRRSANPAVAETNFTVVIEIPKQTGFSNHNGGWIGFSPADGYLYISTGDGGGVGDPNNLSQNLNVLLGKLVRIDVDSDAFPGDPARNYAIPADNPFVGVAGADEIWAYGLRNPWRIAFDPRNGDLYIADVGQGAREEVDYLAAGAGGANFGWRIMEGSLPFNPGPPGTPQPGDPSLLLPVFEYGRALGASITGGEVYIGSAQGFVGQYVFADFISGRLFSLSIDNGVAVDAVERTSQIVGASLGSVVDFATGVDGALYAIGIGGTVWRLDPGPGAEDVGDVLDGGAGDDVLNGGAGVDTLFGRVGNDALDGGIGADAMFGAAGDDIYVVDNTGDVTSEASSLGGIDTVQSSVGRNLTANIENLTLTGTAAIAGYGNILNNVVTGNSAANSLHGFDGDDTLNGAGGADVLFGGNGDDTYIVDNTGDVTSETSALGGTDTVMSSISRNLNANFENLILAGAAQFGYGNILDNVMTGNAAANSLYGFDGNDRLDGAGGADQMFGANGNDTYVVDDAGDVTSEVSVFGGIDTVESSVTRNLTANLENLVLTGADAITGAGNALDNVITGNSAANTLFGLDGADRLDGGLGADTLQGGADADAYVFSSALGGGNIDSIVNFNVADDVIELDSAVFTGLAAGALNADAFHIGAAASDADDRIVYDSATGALYFDADGDGGAAQIQFATLAAGLALTSDDFLGFGT